MFQGLLDGAIPNESEVKKELAVLKDLLDLYYRVIKNNYFDLCGYKQKYFFILFFLQEKNIFLLKRAGEPKVVDSTGRHDGFDEFDRVIVWDLFCEEASNVLEEVEARCYCCSQKPEKVSRSQIASIWKGRGFDDEAKCKV